MPFLSLLLGNWQYVVIGVLVLGIGVQSKRLDWCNEGRAKDKVVAEAERLRLEGAISAQNEAVARLAKESRERKAQGEKALKTAREGTKAARSEAERLRGLAASKPAQNEPSGCQTAIDEIRKGLRN